LRVSACLLFVSRAARSLDYFRFCNFLLACFSRGYLLHYDRSRA